MSEEVKRNLREEIRGMEDLTKELVTIPMWNDMKIEMRSMRGMDRVVIFTKTGGKKKKTDKDPFMEKPPKDAVDVEADWDPEEVFPLLVVRSAYDPETGDRVFEDADVDWLVEKSADAFEILINSALKVNGMTKDAVKEAEGNSLETPG